MRVSLNVLKQNKKLSRSAAGSVVPYSRQDLTKKWMGRIQVKAKDSHSQETFMKLNSLVDYYNKPAQTYKDEIDWSYWKDNVRSEGLVEKIQAKFNEMKTYSYNIDAIAQRSAINSENYDNYGLHLKWNYHLWMTQYLENIRTQNGAQALGDMQYVGDNEMMEYMPGAREITAGWRETGHYLRNSHYFENSTTMIISRQFRYSNRSWQPYWHSVSAWEKGLVIKHVLMSL